jgi:hypothetical protein
VLVAKNNRRSKEKPGEPLLSEMRFLCTAAVRQHRTEATSPRVVHVFPAAGRIGREEPLMDRETAEVQTVDERSSFEAL